jgi:hypothetical protein
MSSFADQLMIRYMDPANVDLLLVPAADATRQRAKALLASVYEPRLLTVQSLDSITVTAKSFQVPVLEPVSVNGTWEKVIPQSERSVYRPPRHRSTRLSPRTYQSCPNRISWPSSSSSTWPG